MKTEVKVNQTKMLKCAHCDKVYKYESERKRHQKSHFPQFECKVCSKKFSFLSALRRHQKQHERTGSVHCLECVGTFRDDTLLKRHMQYAHRGTFYCSKCSSTFSSDLALRTHLKIHKPEPERQFRCKHEGCTKAFNFPHHLRHHELTHTNAKQHFCNVCGKGFIQSHHLKTHIKTHSPENWLQCIADECDKKFITKYAWKKHIGTHPNVVLEGHLPEIKFDSGISSDSSSTSEIREKEQVGDDVLCAFCGIFILRTQLASHNLSCVKPEDSNYLLFNSSKNLKNGKYEQVQAANTPTYIKVKDHDSSNNASEHDVSLAPIVEAERSKSDNNNNSGNLCEGCICADYQSPRVAGNSISNILTSKAQANKIDFPEIEYRIDGIIKIRETFDSEIIVNKECRKDIKSPEKSEELKYVPFNSCKAVLGNCIVSEDGSIGEGCLCARMVVDEQQMSAQEIDELTPNPKQCSVSADLYLGS